MDNNEHGTNLAEVGTDAISRRAAIDSINEYMVGKRCDTDGTMMARLINELVIKQLPPIQPDSVKCKDCKHYRHGLCMKASMCVNKSENGFCDWAEKREVTT